MEIEKEKILARIHYLENLKEKNLQKLTSKDFRGEKDGKNKTKMKLKGYRGQEEHGEKKFIKP